MIHMFTNVILQILQDDFGDDAEQILERSLLLQYLSIKTRSANKGAKARGSFANLYALYVLVEDYINKDYVDDSNSYNQYEGAKFTDLLTRQRHLPFGSKLQNHALNSRVNGEFARLFPTASLAPILRDQQTQRYWINEQLIKVVINRETTVNIAKSIIKVIDAYVAAKRSAFEAFIQACQQIDQLALENEQAAVKFINRAVTPKCRRPHLRNCQFCHTEGILQ